MNLHGQNLIGGERSGGGETFRATNPSTSQPLPTDFHEGTAAEVDRALTLAQQAFQVFRKTGKNVRAALLDLIATKIEALGDALLQRADEETALGLPRLTGERSRTCNQLRLFAKMVEEGSWVDARIDTALPDRKPLPRPDLRRMRIGIGPVVSFSASNFPLAISVAGNDLVCALAAGCPIVVKNHPNHPGTSEMIAECVVAAIAELRLPPGIFSMINGRKTDVGMSLVKHPLTQAVAFTGSLRGGRALFDAAAARPEPIPVFAEMGSINPVFLLPGALAERSEAIAEGFRASLTMGSGQFCTNPGVLVGLKGPASDRFVAQAAVLVEASPPMTMLYGGIRDAYAKGVERTAATANVRTVARSKVKEEPNKIQGQPALLSTDAKTFLATHELWQEVFGPASIFVAGETRDDLLSVARTMEGSLTATLHGTDADLAEYRDLVDLLEQKVGRLIFNGFPTGLEVVGSMHHGGPYPATTDARTTSVGTTAIDRFVRPVSFQSFPDTSLPDELKDANPFGVWRTVNGSLSKDAL